MVSELVTHLKELAYYAFNRLPRILYGKYVRHNLVRVHWGRGLKNFGDCLQPDTLRHYGLTPVYVPSVAKSDVILAGSIMGGIPESYTGYIIGTGGGRSKFYNFPNAQVLAVRGKLLRNQFTPPDKILRICKLGDTGLLTRLVYPGVVVKKYKLGIIFHFFDKNNEPIKILQARFPSEITVISPLGKPAAIVKQIKECEHIISSSLHGLIVADAFGIPNRRWVDRATMPAGEYYDFKYWDYYSSFDFSEEPISLSGNESVDQLVRKTSAKPFDRIDSLIDDLDNQMKLFVGEFLSK